MRTHASQLDIHLLRASSRPGKAQVQRLRSGHPPWTTQRPLSNRRWLRRAQLAQLVMDEALQSQGEPVNERPHIDGAATEARVMLTDQEPRS